MVVQWLRFHGPHAGGTWVQSLVRELRSHMPCGTAKKKKKKKAKIRVLIKVIHS